MQSWSSFVPLCFVLCLWDGDVWKYTISQENVRMVWMTWRCLFSFEKLSSVQSLEFLCQPFYCQPSAFIWPWCLSTLRVIKKAFCPSTFASMFLFMSCMSKCLSVNESVCVRVCASTCVWVSARVYAWVHVYVRQRERVCVCVPVCVFVCVRVSEWMYACVCVCLCDSCSSNTFSLADEKMRGDNETTQE